MQANIPYAPQYAEQLRAEERAEIDQLLEQALDAFDATQEEIQKLSIDCLSNLTTSRALSRELSGQGPVKRMWRNFIGRNAKLHMAINHSHAHAMYANQQLLILLMEQNQSAMEFRLHLDRKQQLIQLDFSEQLSQQSYDIQRICQILQKHDAEMNDVVFQCGGCRARLQRDSVICPHCGRKRPQASEMVHHACQEELDALAEGISRSGPEAADPLRAAYDFSRLCDLPVHVQDQLEALYADTTQKIRALKLPGSRFLQRFQREKLSMRDEYRARFRRDLLEVARTEKELIDETLDQFDHLDDQLRQLEDLLATVGQPYGGAE